jgi:hypothetical protein
MGKRIGQLAGAVFMAAAATLFAGGALCQPAAQRPQLPLANCDLANDPADCRQTQDSIKADYQKAWRGDYQAQRNVAYCYVYGCGEAVRPDRVLGCAWRMVIVAAADQRMDASDISNRKGACDRLSSDELTAAAIRVEQLFKAIYRRPLPAVAGLR